MNEENEFTENIDSEEMISEEFEPKNRSLSSRSKMHYWRRRCGFACNFCRIDLVLNQKRRRQTSPRAARCFV